MTEISAHPDRPHPGPGRNRAFRFLLSAHGASQLGSQLSRVALPLVAVLTLHATALAVGALVAAPMIGYLVIGLPAGVWVDRYPQRRIMIVADLVRAAALLLVPLSAAVGVLALWQLYLAAGVTGFASVLFNVSSQSALPALVGPADLAEANVRMELATTSAALAGPPLAGWLIELLSAATVIVVDVASYLLSALLLFAGRHDEPRPQARRKTRLMSDIREGWRFVTAHRVLRLLALSTLLVNTAAAVLLAVQVPYLVRVLHLPPAGIGLIITAGSLGGACGTLTARRFIVRFGVERMVWLSASVTWPFVILLALARPGGTLWLYPVGWLVSSAGIPAHYLFQVILRQRITPDRLLGRVNATFGFLTYAGMPLGALVGGAIGQMFGLRAAVAVAGAGVLGAIVPLLLLGYQSISARTAR